jgi:hypothetical protein
MKKTVVYIVVVVLGILIMIIILGDFMSADRDRSATNPYAYKIDEYKSVDPELIKYKEIKRIGLSTNDPKSIDVYKDRIGIGFTGQLQVIDTTGLQIVDKPVQGPVSALSFSPEGLVFLAYHNVIEIFNSEGIAVDRWEKFEENAIITSIAFKGDMVFVADAGNHTVYRFNTNGDAQSSFDGTGRLEGNYGFILPSPYFDLEVDPDDQLWVVNPGLLKVENYTDDGVMRAFWGKPSFDVDGFTGCCNPAHIAILRDGSFVTSEKGLKRIKVYKPSGELDCVVAAPDDFGEEEEPADVAVDDKGHIYALDMAQNKIRIFARNSY